MSKPGIVIVYTTIDSNQIAKRVAKEAIEKRLAACVNILPEIDSIYRDGDKVVNAMEYGILFKTAIEKKNDLISWLLDRHPYDTPAIIESKADTSPAFEKWIQNNVN